MVNDTCGLEDDVLLEICDIRHGYGNYTPELLEDLRGVARLVGPKYDSRRLDLAVALLAGALSQSPRFNPEINRYGETPPTARTLVWLDQDLLESIIKQMAGLRWANASPDSIKNSASVAARFAVSYGYLKEMRWDGWKPGMRSGSGWQYSLSATPYGITKAREELVKPPVIPASTTRFKQSPGCPMKPDHATPISRSTPPATPPLPLHDGRESNIIMLPTLPPEVKFIVRHADALASTESRGAAPQRMPSTFVPVPMLEVPVFQPPSLQAPAPLPPAPVAPPAPLPLEATPAENQLPQKAEDLYAWARQAELIRAVDQVIGEDTLNPGVLSKACAGRMVVTNGKPGRAGLVDVQSFLNWFGKRQGLAQEELVQVRNAIIGEISSRT